MKLERIHFAMIIAVIVLLVAAVAIIGPKAPTGLAGIQSSAKLRLNVSVPEGVCILNINLTNTGSPNSTRYAIAGRTSIAPGETTDELTFNITNAGNTRHNVTLNASFWEGPNGSNSISTCNQTKWHNTSFEWSTGGDPCGGNGYLTSGILWGRQYENSSNISYWRVRVPSAPGPQAGEHRQNITFLSVECQA